MRPAPSHTMPAAEATVADAQQLCEHLESMQTLTEECTADAAQRSADTATCEALRDNCIERASMNTGNCAGEEIQRGLATCDGVTTGAIESCLLQLVQAEAALDCDAPLGEALSPPDCFVDITEGCPDLFDGEDRDPDPAICEEDDLDPSGVDCDAFCGPLADSGCDGAPTLQECVMVCEAARTECPTALVRLDGCAVFEDVSWYCDSAGEPDLVGGCGPELQCFGICLDVLTSR